MSMRRPRPARTCWVVLPLFAGLVTACGGPGEAPQDGSGGMPSTIVWTAYDVGSAGYSQAASIGHAMGEEQGVTVRVIPGGNDIARQSPLVNGQAQFGALGIGSFLSQEGVMDFAAGDWGPQKVRILGAA